MTSTEAPLPPGIQKGELAPPTAPALNLADPNKLNVGLFPYVPIQWWFQKAISDAWAKTKHTYDVNFVYYDAYQNLPSVEVDVFGFDAIRLADLKADLLKFDSTPDGFFGWTTPDLIPDKSGKQVLGLPYLGCTNVLIYRTADTKLSKLTPQDLTVKKLQECITANKNNYTVPPLGEGIMVDLTGNTTLVCLYLQSVVQHDPAKSKDPVPLPDPKSLDQQAVDSLKAIVDIAGTNQAGFSDSSGWLRAVKFIQGYGQAFIGYTEHLYYLVSPKQRDQYCFHPLPLDLDKPVGTILPFTDAIGVNAKIIDAKKSEAISLAQLIASKAVLDTALTMRDPGEGNPQFLTPVRQASLTSLETTFNKDYPNVYPNIDTWLGEKAKTQPQAYRLDNGYKDKIKDIAAKLREKILGKQFTEEFAHVFDRPAPAPWYAETPAGLWRRGD